MKYARLVFAVAGSGVLTAAAHARPPVLSEGFDDVSLLPGNGWSLINNSAPLGITNWFQGNSGVFPAHSGAASSYLGANFNNTGSSGTISNWAILPTMTLNNGDTMSFYTRTVNLPSFADRLEVRMSTNGSSSDVGASSGTVGDFSTLMLEINPTLIGAGYPNDWTQFTVTVSGLGGATMGRLAFRYFVTDAGILGNNSDFIGIDTLEVNSEARVIPLPSAALMGAIGLCGVASRRRRTAGM